MKRTRFTETQIVAILKEADSGVPVKDRMPQVWDQRCNLLQLEIQVWRHGGI